MEGKDDKRKRILKIKKVSHFVDDSPFLYGVG